MLFEPQKLVRLLPCRGGGSRFPLLLLAGIPSACFPRRALLSTSSLGLMHLNFIFAVANQGTVRTGSCVPFID